MRATDVVCGKRVDTMLATRDHLTSEHRGEVFYFCSQHCKRIFEASPAHFLVPAEVLMPGQNPREPGYHYQYANG
jgi:YHS domain-containing protein